MNRNEVIAELEKIRRTKTIEFSKIIEMVESAKLITDKGEIDDPFEKPGETLFRNIGVSLHNYSMNYMAIYSLREYYTICLNLQLKYNERIHKGDVLHWLGRVYSSLGKRELSFEYYLLTYIEDIISEHERTGLANGEPFISNAINAPVAQILIIDFHLGLEKLIDLKEACVEILNLDKIDQKYPEELLFYLKSIKKYPIIPQIDRDLYHPNLTLLKSLTDRCKAWKSWEKFAAYIFSCIHGFEPLSSYYTTGGSYQFDVLIRNMNNEHKFLKELGEYIAVECKYFEKETVSVEQLDHFAMKLKYHGLKSGIFFTPIGLSGIKSKEGEPRYGRLLQIKLYNRDGIIIFDITSEDIQKLVDGENFIHLLRLKHEDIRFA